MLDLDNTDIPLHGEQEGRFFHGYYKEYCYLPLYVFCGRHLLLARQRRANVAGCDGAVEEIARIVARIRQEWPRARIILRADSGFSNDELMGWCEANRVDYVFGLARNRRLEAALVDQLAEAKIVQIAILRDGEQLTFPVTIAEFAGNGAKSVSAVPVSPEAPPIAARDLGLELAPLTREVRARLGMTDQDRGVLVEHVNANSAASDRGITAGSVIIKVGRMSVTSPTEAQQRLKDAGTSDRAFILVLIRDEQGLRWMALPLKPANPDPAIRVRGADPHLSCSRPLRFGCVTSEPPLRAVVAHCRRGVPA